MSIRRKPPAGSQERRRAPPVLPAARRQIDADRARLPLGRRPARPSWPEAPGLESRRPILRRSARRPRLTARREPCPGPSARLRRPRAVPGSPHAYHADIATGSVSVGGRTPQQSDPGGNPQMPSPRRCPKPRRACTAQGGGSPASAAEVPPCQAILRRRGRRAVNTGASDMTLSSARRFMEAAEAARRWQDGRAVRPCLRRMACAEMLPPLPQRSRNALPAVAATCAPPPSGMDPPSRTAVSGGSMGVRNTRPTFRGWPGVR